MTARSTTEDQVQTKEQLLDALRASRAHWEALLAEVGEARLTAPGVAGDWSVQDLLGHMTAYRPYTQTLSVGAVREPPAERRMPNA